MEVEREKTEHALYALLDKAQANVPFLRLDSADEVIALFQEAVDLMDANLVTDSSTSASSSSSPIISPQHASPIASALVSAAPSQRSSLSTFGPAAPSAGLGIGGGGGLGNRTDAGGAIHVAAPLPTNKFLAQATVTRDYSSPSQSKRSLSGGVGSSTSPAGLQSKRGSVSHAGPPTSGSTNVASSAPSVTSIASPSVISAAVSALSASANSSSSSSSSSSAPASASSSSSSSSSSSRAGPSSSVPKLGLGLKGSVGPGSNAKPRGASSRAESHYTSSSRAQVHTSTSVLSPSSRASASSSPFGSAAGGDDDDAPLDRSTDAAGAEDLDASVGDDADESGLRGGAGAGAGAGVSRQPSSRARVATRAMGLGSGAGSGTPEGGAPGGGTGKGAGDDFFRVNRPLSARNVLQDRMANVGDFASPKLGPRSLTGSPAVTTHRSVGHASAAAAAAANASSSLSHADDDDLTSGTFSTSSSNSSPTSARSAGGGGFGFGSATGLGGAGALRSFASDDSDSYNSSDQENFGGNGRFAGVGRNDTSGGADSSANSVGGSGTSGSNNNNNNASHAGTSGGDGADADDEDDDEDDDDPDGADLTKLAAKRERRNGVRTVTSKVRAEMMLPAVASPKQYRSSLHLVSLASKQGDADANELPPQGTPKPAYLRRLDSPGSHHGQLVQSKAKLQALLQYARDNLPRVRPGALEKVQAKLEVAAAKLEEACVIP